MVRRLCNLGKRAGTPILLAGMVASIGCSSGGSGRSNATDGPGEAELRMTPERVFDAERPFIRGDPVGIELHWWLSRDTEGDIARALASHAGPTDFLPVETIERLRLSGIRVVAVPLSEVFVLHQIAPPRSGWSRRWLGQAPDWVQLLRTRGIEAGTRAVVYGSESRLPEGVLRLLGRGWIVPQRVERDGEPVVGASMRLEVATQLQQRDPRRDDRNIFELPSVEFVTPDLMGQGPTVEQALLELTVPPGYAIVLTTDAPDADWSRIEGVTRENIIEVLQQREASSRPEDERAGEPEDQPARFGPSPSARPEDVEADAEDERVQMFETLDAPMPSLEGAFGPRAAPVPTVGQMMLETRDRLSRPMRGVVILIPRLPEEFRLLP